MPLVGNKQLFVDAYMPQIRNWRLITISDPEVYSNYIKNTPEYIANLNHLELTNKEIANLGLEAYNRTPYAQRLEYLENTYAIERQNALDEKLENLFHMMDDRSKSYLPTTLQKTPIRPFKKKQTFTSPYKSREETIAGLRYLWLFLDNKTRAKYGNDINRWADGIYGEDTDKIYRTWKSTSSTTDVSRQNSATGAYFGGVWRTPVKKGTQFVPNTFVLSGDAIYKIASDYTPILTEFSSLDEAKQSLTPPNTVESIRKQYNK